MNNLDRQYQALLQDILSNGVQKGDRTGTGTISVFGRTIRHKMSEGFPLITTKKMYFKGIVTELIWFLQGNTNIKYLVDNNCHIWDGDTYKNYQKKMSFHPEENWIDGEYRQLTQEEFIINIKTDHIFASRWGDLGPIYGAQWRKWNNFTGDEIAPNGFEMQNNPIDQITDLIYNIKNNPDSRRLIVNAWNPAELDDMVLPPCHYGFQCYTRELSTKERYVNHPTLVEYLDKKHELVKIQEYHKASYFRDLEKQYLIEHADELNLLPTRALSLSWNQRSVDTFLGLPFNIASYGLLLEILAKECNMVPDELIGNLGDTHLYLNHIEQAKEQIGQDILEDSPTIYDKVTYEPKKVKIKIGHTREPYPLPSLSINTEFWNTVSGECGVGLLDTNLKGFEITDFELKNYQSHPSIKAPLSN